MSINYLGGWTGLLRTAVDLVRLCGSVRLIGEAVRPCPRAWFSGVVAPCGTSLDNGAMQTIHCCGTVSAHLIRNLPDLFFLFFFLGQ